jgi:hypothetical protein
LHTQPVCKKQFYRGEKSVFMLTTVTTVTTMVALGASAVISVAAVIALLAFLTTRELAHASESSFSIRIAKFASAGILPLLMAFLVIVVVTIAGALW